MFNNNNNNYKKNDIFNNYYDMYYCIKEELFIFFKDFILFIIFSRNLLHIYGICINKMNIYILE